MVGPWPKPATSKLSVLVRIVKGTGSAAARAAAAGEAGEPSDGGRSCIGASAVGAVGGGIHRCGSLRGAGRRLWTDRSSAGGVFRWDVLRLKERTRETYKGRKSRRFFFITARGVYFCLGGPHDGVGRVGLGPPVGFFPLFKLEFSQQKKKFSAQITMSTLPKWVI